MSKVIRKIGNSQGLILEKKLLVQIGISVGDEVITESINGKIVITPKGKQ